jgi:hypothetical protein
VSTYWGSLRDILALANSNREGTGWILIGFKECSPHPAEVVGLAEDGAVDDARIQEFVNSKVEPKVQFHYEERIFEGKNIAVISVPKQSRPFYLLKDYGRLSRNVVYVRRGSATGIASPREIASMGEANSVRGEPKVGLDLTNRENDPLPVDFRRAFANFAELPDYSQNGRFPYNISVGITNRNYWRELASYASDQLRSISVRISLANLSEFSLDDTELEVACSCPVGRSVRLSRFDDMPTEPRANDFSHMVGFRSVFETQRRTMNVDDRGPVPIGRIALGCVRPGQTLLAESDLVVLPDAPGDYVLTVKILSRDLAQPLRIEHVMKIEGEVESCGLDDLPRLMGLLPTDQ